MSFLTDLRHRLHAVFSRAEVERESTEELQFHVQMAAERLEKGGVPAGEARRRALARLGGVAATQEAVRDERGTRLFEDLKQDTRHAVRQLLRSPAFTTVAILTLALGMGATTAIFSVVDGVLLRAPMLEKADRLVVVWETDRGSGTTREPASYPDYLDYTRDAKAFKATAAITGGDISLTSDEGEPIRVPVMASTWGFLDMMGVKPILGRRPTADEDRPNAALVALIGERLWQQRFGKDPAILGKSIRLNDESYTIIGVVPTGLDFGIDQIYAHAAYHGPWLGTGDVDVWVSTGQSVGDVARDSHPVFMLARLADGVTLAQAQTEMEGLASGLERAYPTVNANRGVFLESLMDVTLGPVRPVLLVLLVAVSLLLLVACVNVANLLLARGARRLREVAVRTALGAGRGRLARQFMVETVILTAIGAIAGFGLAQFALKALLALAPADIPRLSEVGLDGRVLALSAGVAILVGIVFGLVPTMQSFRVNVMSQIKGDSPLGGKPTNKLRNGLVVAELALSVMLVLSAGLLVRSFGNLMSVDPGFKTSGVLKAAWLLPQARYPRVFDSFPRWPTHHRFTNAVLTNARAIPGVTAAGIAGTHPLDPGFTNSWRIVGREEESRTFPEISVRVVTPGYFQAVGLRTVAGRVIEETDATDQPAVVVINRAASERFFKNQDPIGQQVQWWGIPRRIVGVVEDERIHGITEAAPPAVYAAFSQAPMQTGVLFVHTNGDPMAIASQVREAIRQADPQLAVYGIEPLKATLVSSVGQRRFAMLVMAVFGLTTLVLAMIGIYGVLSYATEQRTREIGIRAALGASRERVVGLVVRQGAVLTAAGLVLGIGGAIAGSKLLAGLLFGVGRLDLPTYMMVPMAVLGSALIAMWIPAWRAAKVAPVEALRRE
jgi:putative ABC transport system permease protein